MSDISPPLPIKRKPLTVNEAARKKAREEAEWNDRQDAAKRRGWWFWLQNFFPDEQEKKRSLRDQRHLYKQPDTR